MDADGEPVYARDTLIAYAASSGFEMRHEQVLWPPPPRPRLHRYPLHWVRAATWHLFDLRRHVSPAQEMELVIREHARKYQYIVSHAMVFQRTDGL